MIAKARSSAKHAEVGQSIAHGGSADMKPFGPEGDCLFVIQIEVVLLNLLLQEASGH
jgi:hypothetical protein